VRALALVLMVLAAGGPASLPDVEDEVMCVECGTALNVSTSPVADQERAFIRRQIAMGKDKEQVKAALVDEFGPGVLALLGVGVAALRWRGRRDEEPAADGPELDPEDRRRLDADLAAYDR